MAEQLFVLRGVPDDEVEEIRQLLKERQINFYETPGGNWGVSLPALWLHDDARFEEARELIADYQSQRAEKAREDYEQAPKRTFLDTIRERPLQVAVYFVFIAVVLYLSVMPFLKLGG